MPASAKVINLDPHDSIQTLEEQLKNTSFKNPFTGVNLSWKKFEFTKALARKAKASIDAINAE